MPITAIWCLAVIVTQRAEERALAAAGRQRRMEMPARDLFEIYERLDAKAAAIRAPVTLDGIWATISSSDYLRSLGCRVLPDTTWRAIELNHIPGVPDGTILMASRYAYEHRLPKASGLGFATYGDPAFDAILRLTAAPPLPPGIRRVSAPIPGTDRAERVGYAIMRRDENGQIVPALVFDMSAVADLVIDADAPVPAEAIEILRHILSTGVREEFRLLAAASRIKEMNEKAARAQTRLAHVVAKHFILSVQRAHRGDANFARQLAVLDNIVEGCNEQRLPRMLVNELRTTSEAGVPFVFRLPAGASELPLNVPRPLLKAAVDLAARQADALHQGRAAVTTEQVLAQL